MLVNYKYNNNGVCCSYFTNGCCSQVMFNTTLLLYLVNRYMKICSGRRRTLNARIVLLATIESLLGDAGINICTSNFVLLPRTRIVYSVILNFNPSPLFFCCCCCLGGGDYIHCSGLLAFLSALNTFYNQGCSTNGKKLGKKPIPTIQNTKNRQNTTHVFF